MTFRDDDPDRPVPVMGNVVASDALAELADVDVAEDVVVEDVDPSLGAFVDEGKPLSQWFLFRRRFLRHKLAVASLIVLILIVLAIVFAPLLTKYEPATQ